MGKIGDRKIKGFTLIEAVMAGALFFIMGIAILTSVVYARHYTEIEKQRTNALTLASSEMERLKRTVFSAIVPSTKDVVIDDNGSTAVNDDLHGTLEVIVKDKDGNVLTAPPQNNNRLFVEIVVTWHPAGNPSNKLLEERLISEMAP